MPRNGPGPRLHPPAVRSDPHTAGGLAANAGAVKPRSPPLPASACPGRALTAGTKIATSYPDAGGLAWASSISAACSAASISRRSYGAVERR